MGKRYKGRIDSMLIDPPYNSHIGYIGYKDADSDDNYLKFMLKRIKLSYELLSPKGFLVINIDEGETDNLVGLCQTVFGKKFVEVHRWKKKHEFFDTNRVVLNHDKKQTDYEFIIICKKENAVFKKLMQPYIENGVLKEKEAKVPEIFDCFKTTSSAKDEIKGLFGDRTYFSTPKPLKLMKELIRATTSKDPVIMDFFAGSGTVGQACHELNREDDGQRNFILVSNSESNICRKIAKVRLEKTGVDYKFAF